MAITYHAGRRIQGLALTESDVTTTALPREDRQTTYSSDGSTMTHYGGEHFTATKWRNLELKTLVVYGGKHGNGSGDYKLKVFGSDRTTQIGSTITGSPGVSSMPTSGSSTVTFDLTGITSPNTEWYIGVGAISSGGAPAYVWFDDTQAGDGSNYWKQYNGYTNYTGMSMSFALTYVSESGDTKPTNVQVGSRFEETDTKKMYHYVENNPTYTPDLSSSSGWTLTAGGGSATIASSEVTLTANSSSDNPRATFDLGATLSDTAWVMTFKVVYSGLENSASGNGVKYGVGLGSSATVTGWNISGSSFIEYDFRAHASTSKVQPHIAGGNSSGRTETLGSLINDPYSATQYVKLYRLTSTTARMEFYLQSDYSDTPVTLNVTMANTPTGLQYLFLRLFYENVSDSNTIVASEFKIYNDTNTVPVATEWKEEGT